LLSAGVVVPRTSRFVTEHISRSDSTIQNSCNKDHLPYFLGSMILAVMIKIEQRLLLVCDSCTERYLDVSVKIKMIGDN
jgi:hypothetical protein